MDSVYRPTEYWNKVSISVLPKPANCSGIQLNILFVQQSLSPWMLGLFLINRIVSNPLERGAVLELTDSFMFDRRDIYISPFSATQGTCFILITLDPYVKSNTSLPPFLYISDKGTHAADPLNTKATILIIGRFTKTWADAEAICETLGGHLPSVTSLDDRKTLEAIILRNQIQHNTTLKYPNNCRVFDPLCIIFIGIHGNKVRQYI